MRALIEEPLIVDSDPLCVQKDAEMVRRILETNKAGNDDLKAFGCVGKHIADLTQCLQKVFQFSATAMSSRDRVILAEQVIGQCLFVLSIIEPPLFDFNAAGSATHINGNVRTLRDKVRSFRELLEQKDEQRRQLLSRL